MKGSVYVHYILLDKASVSFISPQIIGRFIRRKLAEPNSQANWEGVPTGPNRISSSTVTENYRMKMF